MKKKIYHIFMALALLATVSSCEDPEYVAPTADRQGITSLTAFFTSGPFVDQEMARLELGDEMPDRLVIPVPWFYPITSDDETAQYMTNVRVQAALEPNCFISPGLTVLDLTKENEFVYTDAKGNKKNIIITGERVKSNACELMAFNLLEPALSGVIDKASKKVSLIYVDELPDALASYEVSAHATISPDPATTALNYNDGVTLRVTAHDGVTYADYVVKKEVPEKIESGFNKESVELLFNMEPVSNLGVYDYSVNVGPTMAALGGKLVLCYGDGTTPIYINGLTGVKQGEINLGAAVAGSITNDEAENMLIVNHALGGETVNIYRTASVTEAPTLFYSFVNDGAGGLPMGAKIKCIGDIDGDALITIVNEGVAGVTTSSKFTMIQVQGGQVLGHQVVDIASTGLSWNIAPVNTGAIVPRTVNPADGIFECHYPSSATLNYIDSGMNIIYSYNADSTGWGLNPNCMDSKKFNNVNYLALFVVSHFPHWGMGPQLYLYNVNDMSRFTGSWAGDLACLELANSGISWTQVANAGTASGDVVIAPSADGFKLYVYYYDHNSGVLGCYAADCIKK